MSRIALAHSTTPIAVILQWTLHHGIAVIPRTATPSHIAENLAVSESPTFLTSEEIKALDALNEDHPYYWHPAPLFPVGSYKRDC